MSVEYTIESYLSKHADAWHQSGELQRMEWWNNDHTKAVPRSVVRRLQEMENAKVIAVQHTGKKKTAEYRWIPYEWRSRYNTLKDREENNLPMWKSAQARPTNATPQPTQFAPILAYKDA